MNRTAPFESLGHETPRLDLEALHDLAHATAARQRARTGGPILAVEVGSWTGRTALVLENVVDRLYCVDHWLGNPEDRLGPIAARHGMGRLFAAFARNMGPKLMKSVVPCVGPSRMWAESWPASCPLDLVFIDAGHRYVDACADILCWRPHLRPGGLLVLHDRGQFPGVDRALAELMPDAGHAGFSLAYEEVP